MSVVGITGLAGIPYSPWLQPVLVVLMLLNLVSVWMRGRTTGRMTRVLSLPRIRFFLRILAACALWPRRPQPEIAHSGWG
jgi:hypothetical protein